MHCRLVCSTWGIEAAKNKNATVSPSIDQTAKAEVAGIEQLPASEASKARSQHDNLSNVSKQHL